MSQKLELAKDKLLHQLVDAESTSMQSLVHEARTSVKLFEDLETEHKQRKFVRDNFRLVEPQEVILGEHTDYVTKGSKRLLVTKTDEFVYVPMLETLQQILCNEGALSQVEDGHHRDDVFLKDFCDGTASKPTPFSQVIQLHCKLLHISMKLRSATHWDHMLLSTKLVFSCTLLEISSPDMGHS